MLGVVDAWVDVPTALGIIVTVEMVKLALLFTPATRRKGNVKNFLASLWSSVSSVAEVSKTHLIKRSGNWLPLVQGPC